MMDHTLGSGEGENLKTIQHQKYLLRLTKYFPLYPLTWSQTMG